MIFVQGIRPLLHSVTGSETQLLVGTCVWVWAGARLHCVLDSSMDSREMFSMTLVFHYSEIRKSTILGSGATIIIRILKHITTLPRKMPARARVNRVLMDLRRILRWPYWETIMNIRMAEIRDVSLPKSPTQFRPSVRSASTWGG